MACCKGAELDKETLKTNKDIEKELAKDKKAGLPFRLLLLGAGESGKSTIAKQMKILHLNGFTSEEKALFITAIHTNVYQSMRNMIQAAQRFGIELKATPSILGKFEASFLDSRISVEFGKEIASLWKDPAIQKAYDRRSEYQLNDSTKYYMDDVARVTAANYEPTDQDVLRSRVQTTGIIETEFAVDGHKFIMVDVGGQRSERKKWIHCFEDVTAVLFCVGLSEFDQVLYEDNVTNRMHEALKLFHEICQSKWFTYTAMILFLNKSDLFAEKIKAGKSIKIAFPDYNGNGSFEDSAKFVQNKFCAVNDPLTGKPKDVYPHVTCATDTNNVRVVFNAVKDFIMSQALQSSGMMM